jgi:hypothetical protein
MRTIHAVFGWHQKDGEHTVGYGHGKSIKPDGVEVVVVVVVVVVERRKRGHEAIRFL